jgi:dihydroorotate dehydrogenase electron transfer subunit
MMNTGEIISNAEFQAGYRRIEFYAPEICAATQPGQFVHVKIANMRDRILRRPFSISDVSVDGRLTVIYKVVGDGTRVLAELPAGTVCDLMGPLGKPFSLPPAGTTPVIIAGGYGAAATYLLAKRSPVKGYLLLGARSSSDLILTQAFAELGFTVKIATQDGSAGERGMVTALIPAVTAAIGSKPVCFYGCGPMPMSLALAKILQTEQLGAGELSLDHLMCCGVGACFACVIKVKADNEDGWRYARTCKEGPVFNANEIYTGGE